MPRDRRSWQGRTSAAEQEHDAETTPLRDPWAYRYDIDTAEVAEVWRRGSVISSWLLDLTAIALVEDPGLAGFSGHVSDSGEGRWTVVAAVTRACPPTCSPPPCTSASAPGQADFADRLLSAMRKQFGGHVER